MKSKQENLPHGEKRTLTIIRRFFPGVTSVIDAKKAIEIEVTTGDVVKSKKKEHNSCALAIACKRARDADGVVVSISRLYLIEGDRATRYEIPQSAAREITSFDRGAAFEPGVYRLRKPCQTKIMRPRKGAMGKKTGERGERAHRHVTTNIRTFSE